MTISWLSIERDPELTIVLPTEFISRCERDGTSPAAVLRAFIADLCTLKGNGGIDDRAAAAHWYRRHRCRPRGNAASASEKS
jgi:hypothetical protein